jgi:23S rRNA pseudouridine2604 synthase
MVQSDTMSDRPTLKLKPGAGTRNPQRSRVRATTAPRKAAAQAQPTATEAVAGPQRGPRRAPAGTPHNTRAAASTPRAAPVRQAAPARRALPPAAPATAAAKAAAVKAPAAAAPAAAGIRLSKALTEQGIASRREADDWIAAGWVRVDGEMAVLGQRVRPGQRIDLDPAARTQQARSVTILLHKPVGFVSGQAEDGYPPAASLVTAANLWADERRAFHPGHARGLAPAGRLDIDSTGLLVLTQDGRIAKRLIGEHSLVEKEYLVRVAHAYADGVPDSALQLLRHGLELDGEALKPAKVSWANEDQLRIVLQQGKKRQIRRMCEAVGLQVVGLKRVRIGSVVLGKLPPGQWRYLRDDERF